MVIDLAEGFAEEWPRVVAATLRATGDLDLAEESAQEAFARLAERMCRGETVDNIGAWATTVARRIAIDDLRRRQVLQRKLPLLVDEVVFWPDRADAPGAGASAAPDPSDDHLALIFVACDPVLSPEQRIALALRIVCGIPTADIARFVGQPEATVAARLTRAKKAVATADVRFRWPEAADRMLRLEQVLTTVYGVYTLGHSAPSGATIDDQRCTTLGMRLARALAIEYPEHTEVIGLLAVLELSEVRRPGRIADDGTPIALAEVDRSAWERRRIRGGLDLAARALPGGGRFALQAGIAGLHTSAARWEETDWPSIATLYDGLVRVWPAPVARLGRLIARSHLGDVDLAAAIDAIRELAEGGPAGSRRRVMAALGDLYERAGDAEAAASALLSARDGEPNDALRRYYDATIERLGRIG